MKILVVGGTGPIGGQAALHLASKDHDITVASRNPPAIGTGLEKLAGLRGDYLNNTFTKSHLTGFDAIVFAAGVDVRHLPAGVDEDAFYLHVNGEIVPAFAALAKEAGVSAFVHIGSFYPQVLPDQIETDAYVRSRHLADKGVCALSDTRFRAMSLNAPFVVGMPKGMKTEMFSAYVGYAGGLYPNIKPFGPAGATNFISVQSLAEAIEGALERGEGGKSYLLGDENLRFADYFKLFFGTVGNALDVPELNQEHPMLPDFAIIQGRGNSVSYEPDPVDTSLLGYRRNDIARTISEMVSDINDQNGKVDLVTLGPRAANIPELRTLADRYARAMDRRDVTALGAIVTDDAVIAGPGFRMTGRESIQGIPGILGGIYAKTQHIVSQQLAVMSDDSAIAETYCLAHHVLFPETGQSDRVLTWHIRYQDKFERREGQWGFSYRGIVVDWMEIRDIALPFALRG